MRPSESETAEGASGEADAVSDEDEAPAGRAEDGSEASAAKPADGAAADAETKDRAATDAPPPTGGARTTVSRWWWGLLAVAAVEFWVYGQRADIEVCVGKQGETDFALRGHERTDDNRWQFPRCESRLNLGLRSRYDEEVTAAVTAACRGATIFKHRGEGPQCIAGENGWVHRVEAGFIPPWDGRYFEHLFWFLQ